jgi:hypothetical protein
MSLDHDTGRLSGVVLEGHYKDWLLDELNREQLEELMAHCQRQDAESVQLLASYLEQRFPEETDQTGQTGQRPGQPSAGLSRTEALAILGLNAQADRNEIISAHRTLIQKLHPDRGGNDYLAAKINEAKDYLLNTTE